MIIDQDQQKLLGFRKAGGRKSKGFDPEQIKRLEQKIGAALPADYRTFLAEYGGWWISAEFDVDKHCPSGFVQLVEKFYGIFDDPSDQNDLWNVYQAYSDRLSPHLLPIGHDAMGNEIILSLRRKEYGVVSFLDRSEEESPGTKTPKDRGLYKCTDTFTDFIKSLRAAEDAEEEDENQVRRNESPEAARIRKQLLSGKLSFEEQKRLFAQLGEIVKLRKQ